MILCPLCGALTDPRLLYLSDELVPPVTRLIQRLHRGWQPEQGICPSCALSHAQRLASERSVSSLHTTTDPHATFPYYHPDEETTLALADRLLHHTGFDGNGTTIAFLDSGYYPHPDLSTESDWPGMPAWEELSGYEWRAGLEHRSMRIEHYVDLADGGERTGLDVPSLWDGAADSWHGQMTTVLAAGNGLLSGGRFRGYAHRAGILAIKIGRRGGGIPEEDILRGIQWLLEEDSWLAHNVRVLNVSVGGDHAQPWRHNAVCLAAEELFQRGVFVAAAAGNAGAESLLAPAQSPSVMTVGGIDDNNRRWSPAHKRGVEDLALYPHNWGTVQNRQDSIRKPEILAPARWLPSPILPLSPIMQEMHGIASLRRSLRRPDNKRTQELLEHWHRALHLDPIFAQLHPEDTPEAWLAEVWHSLRKRMNADKWIHAFYQHVDGTSTAVAQVSGVAAQMIQANSNLNPHDIRAILLQTALPLDHLPAERTGAGLLQPAAAVAAALRTAGGGLTGLPISGTVVSAPVMGAPIVSPDELREHSNQGTLAAIDSSRDKPVYFGIQTPGASAVSLAGSFTGWQPDTLSLVPARDGWWHLIVVLPPGRHLYRFWVTGDTAPEGRWVLDPENPHRAESGFVEPHSVVDHAA